MVKTFIKENKIRNVSLLGFKSGQDLHSEIARAKCTVLPSIWHEAFGLTVTESFALGTPVIGSKMGAIQENIEDKVNGAIFESGNSRELAEKINWIFSLDEEEYNELVKNSIKKSKEFDIDKYYTKIMDVYNEAILKVKK